MKSINVNMGTSSLTDSFEAGRQAVSEAMNGFNGKPDVLVIFSAMQYNHKELLAGITSAAGNIPMVGGTTAGEISSKGFSSKSLVVMALGSTKLKLVCGLGTNMSQSETQCSKSLIDDLKSKTSFDDALSLLIFPNGMGGDGVKIIEGLQEELGTEFEIVGGYLGDDERFESTFQYYNGKVYKDAMPGLLVCGESTFRTGVGVRSGFESIGNRFYCTASKGNVVQKFDEESALEMYKDLLGEERASKLPGIALEYPFGLIDQKVSIGDKEYF